jgi:hypothetical protein
MIKIEAIRTPEIAVGRRRFHKQRKGFGYWGRQIKAPVENRAVLEDAAAGLG